MAGEMFLPQTGAIPAPADWPVPAPGPAPGLAQSGPEPAMPNACSRCRLGQPTGPGDEREAARARWYHSTGACACAGAYPWHRTAARRGPSASSLTGSESARAASSQGRQGTARAASPARSSSTRAAATGAAARAQTAMSFSRNFYSFPLAGAATREHRHRHRHSHRHRQSYRNRHRHRGEAYPSGRHGQQQRVEAALPQGAAAAVPRHPGERGGVPGAAGADRARRLPRLLPPQAAGAHPVAGAPQAGHLLPHHGHPRVHNQVRNP